MTITIFVAKSGLLHNNNVILHNCVFIFVLLLLIIVVTKSQITTLDISIIRKGTQDFNLLGGGGIFEIFNLLNR